MSKKYTLVTLILISFLFYSCVSTDTGYSKEDEKIIKNIEQGKTEAAFKIIEEEYLKDPEDENLKKMYTSALLSMGRKEEAKALLENQENAESLYKMALIELSEGQDYSALEMLYKALEIDASHSDSNAVLGEIYLNQKKYKKAEGFFLKSLNSDTNNLAANMGMGSLLARKDKLKESLMYYNKTAKLIPDHFLVYADRAKVKVADSDYLGAEEDFNKAIELNPSYYWNYIDRGRMLLINKGDIDASLKDFNKAINMDPDYYYPYVFRAGIYNRKNKIDKAISDYEFVIKKNPGYYFAYEFLGINYFIKKDWNKSSLAFINAFKYQKEEYSYLIAAAISKLKSGEKLDKDLKDILIKTPRESLFYSFTRLFYDYSYVTMASIAVDEEKDPVLKAKFLYYLAEYYSIMDKRTASENLISEFLKIDNKNLLEYKLMKSEFQHLLE